MPDVECFKRQAKDIDKGKVQTHKSKPNWPQRDKKGKDQTINNSMKKYTK